MQDEEKEKLGTTILVLSVVGGVAGLLLLFAIAGFARLGYRMRKLRAEKQRAMTEADSKLEAMAQRVTRLNQAVMKSSKAVHSAASARRPLEAGGRSSSSTRLTGRCQVVDTSAVIVAAELVKPESSKGAKPAKRVGRSASRTAVEMQAQWIMGQEDEAKRVEVAENLEEAVDNMDLDAMDAALEKIQTTIQLDYDPVLSNREEEEATAAREAELDSVVADAIRGAGEDVETRV